MDITRAYLNSSRKHAALANSYIGISRHQINIHSSAFGADGDFSTSAHQQNMPCKFCVTPYFKMTIFTFYFYL